MVSEKKPASSNNILPLVLIIAGLLVLIANFGWFSFGSLVGLVQLWPLLLIAFGVDILLGGRYRMATMLLTVGAGALFYAGVFRMPGVAPGQTQRLERALAGAQSGLISIETGVSELRLRGLEGSQQLLSGSVQTRRGETLLENYRMNGTVAVYDLSTKMSRMLNLGGSYRWDLSLTTTIPLELSINTGVGRSTLDLQNLNLSKLAIDTGVGETVLTLPASGRYQASLNTGVGAATITLPANLAARIEVSKGVGAVNVKGNFIHEGDRYTSANYVAASNRVDLYVSGGVGAITIVAEGP